MCSWTRTLLTWTSIAVFVLFKRADSYVVCPYCNPNHQAYPNVVEAMRGYDVPMGNPSPGRGKSDPGIRNQIFNPMVRNEDAHYALDGRFVTGNIQIKCDAMFSEDVYDSYESYVDGKVKTSTTGYGIQVGPAISAHTSRKVHTDDDGQSITTQDSSFSFPPMFTRTWEERGDVNNVVDFFTKERGSIAVSEAVCLTHKIDVSRHSKKIFMLPFIETVKALYKVTFSDDDELRVLEFKRFVNEYGTHYSSTTEMGTKMTIERRYSAVERTNTSRATIKDCNTMVGTRVFGLQAETDKLRCKNKNLTSNNIQSNFVERMSISTYGSFIAKTLSEWSQQVVSLTQNNAFQPRPIRRELTSIIDLFEDRNFEDESVVVNGTRQKMTMAPLLDWLIPTMANYCNVFEMKCEQSGCGINDDCREDEWCVELGSANRVNEFICVPRNGAKTLPNGNTYIGEEDKGEPNGFGTEFAKGWIKVYEGGYDNGRRHGNGTMFFVSGRTAYSGSFRFGDMDGPGVMYYEDLGTKRFEGIFRMGTLYEGTEYPRTQDKGVTVKRKSTEPDANEMMANKNQPKQSKLLGFLSNRPNPNSI